MSVNQHSTGYSHSWAFFGSGFSKYGELMLIFTGTGEQKLREQSLGQLHSNILAPLFTHSCTQHLSAKGSYYPLNSPLSCSEDPF